MNSQTNFMSERGPNNEQESTVKVLIGAMREEFDLVV